MREKDPGVLEEPARGPRSRLRRLQDGGFPLAGQNRAHWRVLVRHSAGIRRRPGKKPRRVPEICGVHSVLGITNSFLKFSGQGRVTLNCFN